MDAKRTCGFPRIVRRIIDFPPLLLTHCTHTHTNTRTHTHSETQLGLLLQCFHSHEKLYVHNMKCSIPLAGPPRFALCVHIQYSPEFWRWTISCVLLRVLYSMWISLCCLFLLSLNIRFTLIGNYTTSRFFFFVFFMVSYIMYIKISFYTYWLLAYLILGSGAIFCMCTEATCLQNVYFRVLFSSEP